MSINIDPNAMRQLQSTQMRNNSAQDMSIDAKINRLQEKRLELFNEIKELGLSDDPDAAKKAKVIMQQIQLIQLQIMQLENLKQKQQEEQQKQESMISRPSPHFNETESDKTGQLFSSYA